MFYLDSFILLPQENNLGEHQCVQSPSFQQIKLVLFNAFYIPHFSVCSCFLKNCRQGAGHLVFKLSDIIFECNAFI
jgi:hypothetical protein